MTSSLGGWSIWGVATVAISLVRRKTSVLVTGVTNGEGVFVTESDEEASGESPPVEHAHRIKVQKRSVRKVFCIRSLQMSESLHKDIGLSFG